MGKLNSYTTPKQTLNHNKLNLKSKLVKNFDKNKTYEINERGEKKLLPKNHKEILLSESSKSSRQKVKMNINHIKNYSSYSGEKYNNKLIQNLENNNNENRIHNKFRLFKQKDMPILNHENNHFNCNKESFSKIDEDSKIVSNQKMNYEPFDLNLAYTKSKKELKEELANLFEKYKIKYRGINNTKFIVDLKKEDMSLCIKFDKLSIINENENDNDNDIRISIIKLKRLKGNYMSDIKAFEKIINKLN